MSAIFNPVHETVIPGTCNGRLTPSTGVAVPSSDVTAVTTIYFTTHEGNQIGLYDITKTDWELLTFTEKSVAVPSTTWRLFDIFGYKSSGDLALEAVSWNQATGSITGATNASPIVITSNGHVLSNGDMVIVSGVGGNTAANGAWAVANVTTNTFELVQSQGSGAYTSGGAWFRMNETRATATTTQNGIVVQDGAANKRLLGIGCTTGTSGQTEFSETNRLIANVCSREEFNIEKRAGSSGHTYSTNYLRYFNNDGSLTRVNFVQAIASAVLLWSNAQVNASSAGDVCLIRNALDTILDTNNFAENRNTGIITPYAQRAGTVAAGFHFSATTQIQISGTGTYNQAQTRGKGRF